MNLPAEANPNSVDSEIDLEGTFTYDGVEVRFSFEGDACLEELAWAYDAAQATLRTTGPGRTFIVLQQAPIVAAAAGRSQSS